jgi:Sin3 histone deacetylase corepressor complex component SDS3
VFFFGWVFYCQPCVEAAAEATYEAVISAVGNEAIWVRRQEDSTKQKICITQLTKGKILLKRRAP